LLLRKARNTTSTALAIMADSILLVQVCQQDGRVRVAAQGTEAVPEGCFSEHGVKDSQQLGRAIRALWTRVGIKDRAAAVVLPSAMCGLRSVRLPDLPDPERRSVLRGELEHSGAIPFRGGAFDFIWVREPSDTEPAPAEAFSLYTSEEIVNDLRAALRHADLQLAALEPVSVGVFRACSLADPGGEPRAALCLDDTTADFCILEGSQIRYLRRIASGWADLRDLLDEHGDPPRGPAGPTDSIAGRTEPAGVAAVAAREHHTALSAKSGAPFLVAETVRSLAYYARAHGGDQRPETLAIAASLPDFHRLEGFFRDVGVPTPTAVDPGLEFGIELPNAGPVAGGTLVAHALAAIGTAASVAGFTTTINRIDLGRDDPATKVHNPWGAALLPALIGSGIWLLLTLVIWFATEGAEDGASAEESNLKVRLADTRTQQAPLLELQELQQKSLEFKLKSEIPAAALLGQVAAASQPQVTLRQLSTDTNQMVTLTGEAVASDSVLQYAYALGSGKTIRQPRITLIRQGESGYVDFQISGKLIMTPPETTKQPAAATEQGRATPAPDAASPVAPAKPELGAAP
jgi:hypothetical protein